MGFLKENRLIKMVPARYVEDKLPRLKTEANMGCVRETPHRKAKQAWDV